MFELPLFPLQSVLFPGMTINLHIFEERYKEMINLCIETRQPFGVVLIQDGVEALGPLANPHVIGCTAQIVRMLPRGEGRMDISAVGQERFLIQRLSHDRSYLTCQAELYPLANDDPLRLMKAGNRLRPWVERYLEILSKVGNIPFNPQQLPNDPLQLGYLAAAILQQISMEQKQDLLASNEAVDLLKDIRSIYFREVTLLDMMLERANNTNSNTNLENGSFSVN
jgi:Lon protease-like protein